MPHNFSVLIVEDDDDARRNMEDILALDGYQIRSASHCLQAIVAVESSVFDVIIVDWRLPDQNADDLLPIIVEKQPDVPVVVVTGMRDFDTAVTALRSGAYDFLLKPINPDVLRSVLRRIVERKGYLAAIEEGRNKLLMNERLAAIGQMVTGLAHESRNAFQRSHACLSELALDLEGMPQSLELVRKVQKALDDLHFLLEEVRNYSAPIILERRECDLVSIINDTWQAILEAKPNSQLPKLKIDVDPHFPDSIYVDGNRIQMVIRNLLENAVFVSPPDGDVVVRLTNTQLAPRPLRIEVADQGEGIAKGAHEKIFTPFFTTKTKGTGLGLAITRRYIDSHNGLIFADPNAKTGAQVIIELPNSARKHK